MLRHRTGTAGCHAGGLAAARYFLGETLRPDNELLAKYYAGESVPHDLDGIEHLGRAIAAGDIAFSAAAAELVAAHGRMHGYPDDREGLETRITDLLLKAADRSDMRETLAVEGGTVARVREDLDPRLAERLGIDTARPLTQGELANLLAGARADGEAIEGKQIKRPMKSIAEVFGLDAAALPAPDAIDHVLAGRRADGDAPRSAEGNGEPLSEAVIDGARKRFLNAYGLPSGTELAPEHIEHMKAGPDCNRAVPGHRRRAAPPERGEGADLLYRLHLVRRQERVRGLGSGADRARARADPPGAPQVGGREHGLCGKVPRRDAQD